MMHGRDGRTDGQRTDKPKDGWTDRWTDGGTDGWTNRRTNRWTNQLTNTVIYRLRCPQQKIKVKLAVRDWNTVDLRAVDLKRGKQSLWYRVENNQGRIHDNSCRGWLSRGSNDLGRGSNDIGRCMLKYKLPNPQNAQKCKKACDRPTDRRKNGPIRWLIQWRTDKSDNIVGFNRFVHLNCLTDFQ